VGLFIAGVALVLVLAGAAFVLVRPSAMSWGLLAFACFGLLSARVGEQAHPLLWALLAAAAPTGYLIFAARFPMNHTAGGRRILDRATPLVYLALVAVGWWLSTKAAGQTATFFAWCGTFGLTYLVSALTLVRTSSRCALTAPWRFFWLAGGALLGVGGLCAVAFLSNHAAVPTGSQVLALYAALAGPFSVLTLIFLVPNVMLCQQIETTRLLLRPLVDDDAEALARIVGDAVLMRYVAGGPDFSREETLGRIARARGDWIALGFGAWAIIQKSGGALIGFGGLSRSPTLRQTNLICVLAREAWHQGFALESCMAAIQYAFVVARLPRLLLFVDPDNRDSIRLIDKLGARFVETIEIRGLGRLVYAIERPKSGQRRAFDLSVLAGCFKPSLQLAIVATLGAAMLFATGCSRATQSMPVTHVSGVPASASNVRQIDAFIRSVVTHQQLVGLSFAIVRGGKVVDAGGYGWADLARRTPADANSIYDIGSISKQFAAALVLRLRDRHELSIGDPLARFIPSYKHSDGINIRDLLAHESGVPDYLYLPGYDPAMSAKAIVTLVDSEPLRFAPGSRYEYSNTNYVMLGQVVEAVTHTPFATVLREWIFRPVQMHASAPCSFVQQANLADAGICSSVLDLARWDLALMSGRVLGKRSLAEMFAPASHTMELGTAYGYGVRIGTLLNMREIYHRGEFAGYSGLNAMFPDQRVAIILLSRSDDFQGDYLVERILHLYYPEAANTRSPIALSAQDRRAQLMASRIWQTLQSGDVRSLDRLPIEPKARARLAAGDAARFVAMAHSLRAPQSFDLISKDSRYLGTEYTYRLRFTNAVVQMRLGTHPGGTVWNLVLERAD